MPGAGRRVWLSAVFEPLESEGISSPITRLEARLESPRELILPGRFEPREGTVGKSRVSFRRRFPPLMSIFTSIKARAPPELAGHAKTAKNRVCWNKLGSASGRS